MPATIGVVSWSVALLVPLLASCGETSTMSLPTLKQAAYYAGVDEPKFGVCQFDIETEQCAVIHPAVISLDIEISRPGRDPISIQGTLTNQRRLLQLR